MTTSKDLLYQRYIAPIKEHPKDYVGVEFEFPIVNIKGQATDLKVSKGLLEYLMAVHSFEVVQRDEDGAAVQVREPESRDLILFEVSYNILEFAFEKAVRIQDVDRRFQRYLSIIQPYLRQHGHELQGWGVHPHWDINDNQPVKLPRYRMLLAYLALSTQQQTDFFHPYPAYGAFICGNQVQLDVSPQTLLPTLNRFNQLEPLKAYLLANSPLWHSDWDTRLSRDIFWEHSMHGVQERNIGLYDHILTSQEDLLDYLDDTSLFTAKRDGRLLYFYPIKVKDYLSKESITAYDLDGRQVTITPQAEDFKTHRSYNYEDLTTRGTVEFRSTCTQALDENMAAVALHVGLFHNLAWLGDFLDDLPLYAKYRHDYKSMRQLFAKKTIPQDDEEQLKQACRELIQLAKIGLTKRGYGEESYLEVLELRVRE